MEEIHEHHHEDAHSGSSLATILTVLVALLVIGILLWNFLPIRSQESTLDVNLNTPQVGDTNTGTQ